MKKKKSILIVCLLFLLTSNMIYSKEQGQEKTMDLIEGVIRWRILNPPHYPTTPTHIEISLPEGYSLDKLRERIPDSPLPIISKDDINKVGDEYGGCYLKSTGEKITPYFLNFKAINVSKRRKPPKYEFGDDTETLWFVFGEVCQVGNGFGGWAYLQKKGGKWVVAKIHHVIELD